MEIWILAVLVCSLLTVGFSLRTGLASRMALDQPNARSLHTIPTPRVGGLLSIPWAILAGMLWAGQNVFLLTLAALLCAFSFLDDRIGLSVIWRLCTHLGVALAAVLVVGTDNILLLAVLTLTVTWMINLYNFMDGADGLAGGMAVFGFSAFGVAALLAGNNALAGMAFCLVAAAIGFLAFNFPPARIFMGDAGSTTLGFLAGALGILGWRDGAWPAWFPILVFSPFIVDASYTLMRRALRREKIWQAHREHCYQKLVRMGWSHRQLALSEYTLMVVAALGALALLHAETEIVVAGLLSFAFGYALIIIVVGVKWRAFQEISGP